MNERERIEQLIVLWRRERAFEQAREADQLQQAHCSFKAGPQSCVLAPPAHWSAQARDGIVKYFDVHLDSQEAAPLVVGFRKTAEDAKFDILKIERVQNLPLVGEPG